jgi:hypothetical protein
LHWYTSCRLVIEGGFNPDEITPHPPFRVEERRGHYNLIHDPSVATGSEQTILGGLKTKNVDVVVNKGTIGPVIAISCKGATKAFRNLTNRMEETVGDCTNLHITYPAMVTGYLVVMRANTLEDLESGRLERNDVALTAGGIPVEPINRFHNALAQLTGRRGIRNDISRYEAVALALVSCCDSNAGLVLPNYPPDDSPLRLESFFQDIYRRYDERFVYSAPDIQSRTRRIEWSPTSEAFQQKNRRQMDYEARMKP